LTSRAKLAINDINDDIKRKISQTYVAVLGVFWEAS